MSFDVPQQSDVNREAGEFILPDQGYHDVTITEIKPDRSSSGNPMMVLSLTIDNGEFAGHEIREYLVFFEKDCPPNQHPTWAKLACIMDAAGFEWEEQSNLEAFTTQFPLNKLRLSVDVVHSYSVLAYVDDPDNYEQKVAQKDGDHPYEEWVDVTPQEYDEWPDLEKNKYKRAQVRDGFDFANIFQEAKNPPELMLNGQYEGDNSEESDDGLPF